MGARAAGPGVATLLLRLCPNAARTKDGDGRLPLAAAAAAAAPTAVISVLLSAWPRAAFAPSQGGLLPLHHAVSSASQPCTEATLRLLLGVHPGAAGVATRTSRATPLLIACRCGGVAGRGGLGGTSASLLITFLCSRPAVSLAEVSLLLQAYPGGPREANKRRSLPLHAACLAGARSPEVFAALVDAYPAAARERSALDLLPLHLAVASCGDVESVSAILAAFPQAGECAPREGGHIALHDNATFHSLSPDRLWPAWHRAAGLRRRRHDPRDRLRAARGVPSRRAVPRDG